VLIQQPPDITSPDQSPPLLTLAAYLVSFYAVWSGYILLITPHFGGGPLFLLLETLAKLAVWTCPVLIFIRYVDRQDPLAYLRLRQNTRRGVLYGLLFGTLVAAHLIGVRLLTGFHGFDLGFAWSQWINGVVLIGLTEEVVFRGLILQRLLAVTRFRWANLATSLLFVLIHFPRWIRDGQLAFPGIVGAILYVFAFSYLQGFVLKKSGSLWSCFLVHAIGNLISFALGSGV
jgi:membrane protease YdiL (CAAX protease family)